MCFDNDDHARDAESLGVIGPGTASEDDVDPEPADTVHVAIDDLLVVVAKAADDLRMFHDTVSRARIAVPPPFPRATVILTLSVIERLREVEHDLQEILTALGLPESPDGGAT